MRAAFLGLALLAVAACSSGGSGTGNAANTPSGKSCRALCDKELMLATDCPPDALGNCKTACDELIPLLDADCRAKAQAAYDCTTGNVTAAACNGGNLPLPTTPSSCGPAVSTFTDCATAQTN